MAFATASNVTYATALFTTALAMPILGKRVGLIRRIAVLVGFLEIIMVIQLGTEVFSAYAFFPLAAAALQTLVGITSRLFDDAVLSALLNLYSSFSSLLGAALVTYFLGGFRMIEPVADVFLIISMGILGGAAVLLLLISYRVSEHGNLEPFSHFGLLIPFFLGCLFFKEAPWITILPGGLFLLREKCL